MELARKNRLADLREKFAVAEVNGTLPPHDVVGETIAAYLNRKHGRRVVVRRDGNG